MATVRRVRPEDGPLLRELAVRALADAPGSFGGTIEQERANPARHYEERAVRLAASDRSTKFLLFDDDALMGGVTVFFEDGHADVVFLGALWVDPRTRRQGGGRRLVDAAMRWSRARAGRICKAWVSDHNTGGRAFWRACGFRATSQQQPLPSDPAVLETLHVCP